MNSDLILTFAIAVLLLPLVGFVLMMFFGRKLPRNGDWLETLLISSALALSIVILVQKIVYYPTEALSLDFTWVSFGDVPGIGLLKINLGFAVDNLAAVMLVVVTLISTLVHFFSIGYMHGDIRYARYFGYLGLFSFSMLMIVLANNLFLLYVGWELVGLSSYLLIGHWYEKKSASDAAMKAFIVNRVGDVGFFIGIMILFATYHTFMLSDIYSAMASGVIPFGNETFLTVAGILIFCGAIGKSAQFPLHVWLPDAMEGPTPVSALIHAATMVAAGVYLVARTFPLMTADALTFIAYIGAITAFIAATIAIAQNDIKKVLAYSTISQLGYMVMALGVGAFTAGFFHLTTHAMFKAGLFLGSGSVIHAMHHSLHLKGDHHTDPQDIRNMGGLRKKMPVTFWTFLVYTLAISGVPLTSGFLSKDSILAGTIAFHSLSGHWFIPLIGFLVAGMTAFYMFRIMILAFLGDPADKDVHAQIHESPRVMTMPLVILAGLSFFLVFTFTINPFSTEGWFTEAIVRPATVVPASVAAPGIAAFEEETHYAHTTALLLSLAIAGAGILVAFATYYWKKISADRVALAVPGVHAFLLDKWGFDRVYNGVVVAGTLALTNILRWVDDTIVDGVVNGTATWTKSVVFGFGQTPKEGRAISAGAFLLAGIAIAIYVAITVGTWMWPVEPALGSVLMALLFAVGAGGLVVFMVWAGAGGFDSYVVDGLVNASAYVFGLGGLILRKLQTGKIQTYILLAVLGGIVLYFVFALQIG